MKKHFVGFIIFSLVIGANIIVGKLLHKTAMPKNILVISPNYAGNFQTQPLIVSEKIGVTVKLVQATFNQPTKQLKFELLLNRSDKSLQEANFKLHFFVYDGKEIRFLATEKGQTTFGMNIEDNRVINSSIFCEWLDNLESKENIYVWVETISNDKTVIDTKSLIFIQDSLIPVLFDYSMDDYNEEHSPKGC